MISSGKKTYLNCPTWGRGISNKDNILNKLFTSLIDLILYLYSEPIREPKGQLEEGRLIGLLILTVSPWQDQQESWERAGCQAF